MQDKLSSRAKEIIENVTYLTIASVTKDGEPWNSPVFGSYDTEYNFYWNSKKSAQHSKNIRNNPSIFIVIYDTNKVWGEGEGVYIQARAEELVKDNEIEVALACHFARKKKPIQPVQDFKGDSYLRIYKAVPTKAWCNTGKRVGGHFTDKRVEIKL